jgi:ribonuclease Z
VWELLSDPHRYPELVEQTQRMVHVPDMPMGRGYTYKEYAGVGPFKGESDWTVTEFQPEHRQVHEGDDGTVRFHLEIVIEPTGTGCRLRQRLGLEPRGVPKVAMILLWPLFMRRLGPAIHGPHRRQREAGSRGVPVCRRGGIMLTVTLVGTGSPIPDPNRAGPATLVSGGGEHFLVDTGRGVLMRLAAAGVGAGQLSAVLLTHLHSDHLTDLNDVITTRWITTFERTPLVIVGPVGTATVVEHLLASLAPDIAYRLAHHADLDHAPPVEVVEVADGPVELGGAVSVSCAPTDHRPVEPSIGFRFDLDGASVVVAGDTVPCEGLDGLCTGAKALVHTAIRKDVIAGVPLQRLQDTLDYHSSPEEAAQTAQRAAVDTLVLTHYVPAFPPGGGDDWRQRAAAHFDGSVEIGDDLHRVEVPAWSERPSS